MNSSPLVSICIPTYNQSDYITSAVESAINQSYENKEIIIFDDNSTDDTWEKLQPFFDYKNVNIFKNKDNIGIGNNWNRCIEYSNGEFVKFLFGDDLFYKDCVLDLVKGAEICKDAGLVFSERDIILGDLSPDNLNIKRFKYYLKLRSFQKLFNKNIYEGHEFLNMIFPACLNIIGEPTSILIKREVFKKVGYFDADFKQLIDLEMLIRIFKLYKSVFIKKPLSVFRIHDKQATKTNERSKRIMPELCMIFNKHSNDLKTMINKNIYSMFSWYVFMNSTMHRADCLKAIDKQELNRIRKLAFYEQGNISGILNNSIRFIYDKIKENK